MSAEKSPFGTEPNGDYSTKNGTSEVPFLKGDHTGLEWLEAMSSDERTLRVMALMSIEGFYQPVLPLDQT